jgi:hypothetical protein
LHNCAVHHWSAALKASNVVPRAAERGIAVGGTRCSRSLVAVLVVGFVAVSGCGGATHATVDEARHYDPTKPVDLSGTPGVTAAEQKRAETLVKETLADLPKYADPAAAERDGYYSVGDAATHDEHFVKWSYVDDGHILDPTRPECLVYEMRNGKKTLVAAMYMLSFGSRFTDAPDVGGALTQWHFHPSDCLTDSPDKKVLLNRGFFAGPCPPGTSDAFNMPMLHVWIVPNRCGPFAPLRGIFGGRLAQGEKTALCDTIHGSTTT